MQQEEEEREAACRREEIEAEQRRREWPEVQARRAGEYERQARAMRAKTQTGGFHTALVVGSYAFLATAWHEARRWRAE